MRRARSIVAILTVIVWGLFVPVAMTSGGCVMCEDPCGISSCVVSDPVSQSFVASAAPAYLSTASEAPQTVPVVLELPPK